MTDGVGKDLEFIMRILLTQMDTDLFLKMVQV